MDFFLAVIGLFIFFKMLGRLIFPKKTDCSSTNGGVSAWDGQQFDVDDPRVPEVVRARIKSLHLDKYQLFYASAPKRGEWWLMVGDELVDGYWVEP